MNFKEYAEEFIRENFSDKNITLTQEDPIGVRMEFCDYLNSIDPEYSKYDLDIPKLLVLGLEEKFEEAASNKEFAMQILTARATLYNKDISECLPHIMPPFAQQVFPNKSSYFEVQYEDLVPETDIAGWTQKFDELYNYQCFNCDGRFDDMFWLTLTKLEETFPGIIKAMLETSFVDEMMSSVKEIETGRYLTSDYYEFYGESLGMDDLWYDEYEKQLLSNITEDE